MRATETNEGHPVPRARTEDHMSDQSAAPVTPAQPSKSDKPARKSSARKSYSVTDLSRARLRKRGIRSDATLANENKVTRGILRANFEFVRKGDARVKKAKDAANDRKPWPTDMGAHAYDVVVNGKRPR